MVAAFSKVQIEGLVKKIYNSTFQTRLELEPQNSELRLPTIFDFKSGLKREKGRNIVRRYENILFRGEIFTNWETK